ncbi:hypothetical protein [Maritalea myrionectae]|uniref:hypothetical protein n=1 Tax=Maritalea myrionectae TaxID=454601 RepID=UPI0003F94034|nr:hypothetical protein [Maritalea myrionectae]
MNKPIAPKGNENREAVASLGGYVYQVYQAALAWIELDESEFLFLEAAEDYVIAAQNALNAVQIKGTSNTVTINSDDIIASIDSFVELRKKNPQLAIRLRHLTTSQIGKEKSAKHRIGDTPTLEVWRNIARTGDVSPLRDLLLASKLSRQTKTFIASLSDVKFREEFLRRIHFDCGALDIKFLKQQLHAKIIDLLQARGGTASQASECVSNILVHLLEKSTQQTDRFVDRASLEQLLEAATHVPINRAQLDAQNELIAKALAGSIPKPAELTSSRLARPRPIDDVPLPAAIAQRSVLISSIVSSLEQCGVSWVLGAAGVGKTVAARLAALREGGNWASVNLRGLSAEQVSDLLAATSNIIAEEHDIHGLLIDDLECNFEPDVVDKFLNLSSVCKRRDLLLLVTAPRNAPSDLLFIADLPATIETILDDFTEEDVQEILTSLGVEEPQWAKYIHLISGGGHPQLAIAAIQSMQRAGWDTNEFRTLNSILVGNPEVDQVRSRTRERLLQELPEGSRRLLERLSLASRGFKRELVLDLAQVSPPISDAGILFDQFVGAWVDQQERDRFSLSPLLSNFAHTTLTIEQKQEINFEIANSIVKSRNIDPIEANSALLAAWVGKNEAVMLKLCLSIIGSDNSDTRMIAPHLLMLTHMRTDEFAYEDNPIISQIFRGAQLLLLCYEDKTPDHFLKALQCFERETARIPQANARAGMALIIYSKLLLSEPVFGPVPQFWKVVQKLAVLFKNQDESLPNDIIGEMGQGSTPEQTVGFMFLFQARQLRKINELVSAFDFLESCDERFRAKIFEPYDTPELLVDIDMLISGAWLREHDANTIDPSAHSSAYAHMEQLASGWGRQDLAVACRKYQAIILDEYGNDKVAALSVLDEGLGAYGSTNSELIRAKAKVLYRANEHQASLEISSTLIEGDAPLSETEKAFLGREAAISAEKQGDLEAARRYFLYGADAAEACGVPDMVPMHIGLLADAALASWHAGDRETCLLEIAVVLEKLSALDSKGSLRAAHCHAVSRHILLWLDQEATGEMRYIENGEIPRIYPGLVSNPEPHSDIGKRFLPALELSWYMLAQIENHCLLDIGITKGLDAHLPNGPVREGLILLTQGKMYSAFHLRDVELFVSALANTVAEYALMIKLGGKEKSFNAKNVTYGGFPLPTVEEMNALITLTEQQIVSFAATCILDNDAASYDRLLAALVSPEGFRRRDELVECLAGKASGTDFYTSYASLLYLARKKLEETLPLSPSEVFEFAMKLIQTGKLVGQNRLLSKQVLIWLRERWSFILEEQRFLLKQPSLHEATISDTWEQYEPNETAKVLAILLATLPTLGISNQREIVVVLENMLKVERQTIS